MLRTTLFVLALALAACGPDATVAPDPDPLDSTGQDIIGGGRTPTAISLTARQKLAVGAVLDGTGGWSNECTGTLISPTHVLTAAHCVEGLSRSQLGFAIGTNSAAPQESQVAAAVSMHPGYDPDGDARNDVAVLRFAQPFTKADPIAINCDASIAVTGKTLQLVGYGATATDDYNATQWWVAVPAVATTSYDLTVNGRGKGTCYGDSGGPALLSVGGTPKIMGVLSWGDECGWEDHFARADHNCAFIKSVPGFAAPVAPSAPAATTIEGVSFTAAQATAALQKANTASLAALDDAIGLERRAAEAIVARRPFASLQALAAAPYVGTVALTRLRGP